MLEVHVTGHWQMEESIMGQINTGLLRFFSRLLPVFLWACWPALGQSSTATVANVPPAVAEDQSGFDARLRLLSQKLDQTQAELAKSQEEIRELRATLEQVLLKMGGAALPVSSAATHSGQMGEILAGSPPASPQNEATTSTQINQDDWQVVNARVEEQAQDKVESRLKYRLKLSGIVLFNAFGVSGQVDNMDVPTTALPPLPGASSGSVGASLRQSILGLTGVGPDILGARTSGDIQMDFFGGLPYSYGGQTSGLARLRTARVRFDWANISVIAGLDVPFFSPNMPSSYFSVAVPGFSTAGNLWTWTPTIRVEQRFDTAHSRFKVEAGILDPTSYVNPYPNQRVPTPGENSRQPAYAVRLSVNNRDESRPMSFGISGVYSPQRYYGGTNVSSAGGIADWKIQFLRHVELSGEAFGGKGLDGFGGVPGPVVSGNDYSYYGAAAPALARVKMFGGWSELKLRVDPRSEFNVGIGSGARNSSELRAIAPLDPALASLSPRNDLLFVNYIFRPRSDIVLSPEFRRLRTYQLAGIPAIADQIGLSVGFLF
jgi:hypothetical protein